MNLYKWPALRLAFIPGLAEALFDAGLAVAFFRMPVTLALAMGFILKAVGPGLVVPAMFQLQNLGLGAEKGEWEREEGINGTRWRGSKRQPVFFCSRDPPRRRETGTRPRRTRLHPPSLFHTPPGPPPRTKKTPPPKLPEKTKNDRHPLDHRHRRLVRRRHRHHGVLRLHQPRHQGAGRRGVADGLGPRAGLPGGGRGRALWGRAGVHARLEHGGQAVRGHLRVRCVFSVLPRSCGGFVSFLSPCGGLST